MKVLTAEQMRRVDRTAIEERGISGLTLMENAGRAVTDELMETFGPDRVAIVTGKGNNAGDGFVVARLLVDQGVAVAVFMLCPGSEMKGDALTNYTRMPEAALRMEIDSADSLSYHLGGSFDCVVDAILGTGVQGPVTGVFGDCIRAINASGLPVAAVDLPSGLPADGGPIEGPVVKADLTVTLGAPKRCMVVPPTDAFIRRLVVADIGLPSDLLEADPCQLEMISGEEVNEWLHPRPRDGHKGTFGSVLVVAGSRGMTGACILCAQGAQRAGAGLVYTAVPEHLERTIETCLIDQMQVPVVSETGWFLDAASTPEILEAAARVDVVALGPGLGTTQGTRRMVNTLIERIEKPMVLDADALNILTADPASLIGRAAPTIITPHPGELGRLLGRTAEAIQEDRLGTALEAARSLGALVVLKGAGTVVATPEGVAWVNLTGNHGMAKGGCGDVLTGLIAGLWAQAPADGLSAARVGVFIHGLAGDILAHATDPRALTASDLAQTLGQAFAANRNL